MKMHHLDEEEVKAVMEKVQAAVGDEELDADKIEEIFKLSKVEPEGFLSCKSNEVQASQVNFEIDQSKGVRFFDPFNFYTQFMILFYNIPNFECNQRPRNHPMSENVSGSFY